MAQGLVFVRHSLLLSLCSIIVEALRYNNIDVSMYWTSILIVLDVHHCQCRLGVASLQLSKVDA